MSTQAATLEATAPKASAPMRGSVDQRGDTNRIKLSWLIRLHWGGVVGQTASIFAARCHRRIAGRPTAFKQVDLEQHVPAKLESGVCLDCHNPHSPKP